MDHYTTAILKTVKEMVRASSTNPKVVFTLAIGRKTKKKEMVLQFMKMVLLLSTES